MPWDVIDEKLISALRENGRRFPPRIVGQAGRPLAYQCAKPYRATRKARSDYPAMEFAWRPEHGLGAVALRMVMIKVGPKEGTRRDCRIGATYHRCGLPAFGPAAM